MAKKKKKVSKKTSPRKKATKGTNTGPGPTRSGKKMGTSRKAARGNLADARADFAKKNPGVAHKGRITLGTYLDGAVSGYTDRETAGLAWERLAKKAKKRTDREMRIEARKHKKYGKYVAKKSAEQAKRKKKK